MKKNVNETERIFRGVGGAAISSLAFLGPANPIFLIGLVPVATAIFGTCPLYSALHVSSRKDDYKGDNHSYIHPA